MQPFDDYKEILSLKEMKLIYPDLKPGMELILVKDRIYKKEGGEFYLLSNEPMRGINVMP